jgi:hypothetical protein
MAWEVSKGGEHAAGAEAHVDSVALAARSKTRDEKANMDSCLPMSENPDMGHPASVFSSICVGRRPMETRLKPCPKKKQVLDWVGVGRI